MRGCTVASAPAIWQRAMDQVLQGLPMVQCYLDDIIVTGRSTEEHLQMLEEVLTRLETHGLRANKAKCKFLQPSVTYCGHVIAADALHQSKDKTVAVREMPNPTNMAQLRSFLGMAQYYSRFLPNLATLLEPLHSLLKREKSGRGGKSRKRRFKA